MSISINEEWEEIRARLVRGYFEDYPNVIPDSDPEDSWAGSSDKISSPTPLLDASPTTPSLNSIPEDSWVKTSNRLLSSSTPRGNPFTSTPDSTPLHRRPCSPLPELIIEKVKEDPNKYDDPEEFYEQLAKDVQKYMKRLEKGDCSYSDFEREESQDLGEDCDVDDDGRNRSMTHEILIEREHSYDDGVNDEGDDQLYVEVSDKVDDEANVEVDGEVSDEVDDEVEVEVNDEADDAVDDEVSDEVDDRANDEVGDKTDVEVDDETDVDVEAHVEDHNKDGDEINDEVSDEVSDEGDDEAVTELDDELADKVVEVVDEAMQVDGEGDLESQPIRRTMDVGVQCKMKDNRIGLFFSGAPTITKFCKCDKHDFLRRV